MRRYAVLIVTVAALLLASGGTANAAPATHWTCDGQVCLTVLHSSAVPQDATGCNGKVCIYVTGDASHGYSTSGQGRDFYGHIHIWGPGGLNVNGRTAWAPVASGSARGKGQTCAQGWQNITGGYRSVGLPCEQVS
jgi:hypothetical protein